MRARVRIEHSPDIMGGKPVVRGTRVPVETVLRKPGAGMTPASIVRDHPRLALEDIQATPAFAADQATPRNKRVDRHPPLIVMARLVRATYTSTVPRRVARTSRAMTIRGGCRPDAVIFGRRLIWQTKRWFLVEAPCFG
ncbi:MAG: DUF433 domain-containing protein [Acetobacteraceae bacterium]|nr:DUF433 domain-containing protein [Acetobacteraceae bacterium]